MADAEQRGRACLVVSASLALALCLFGVVLLWAVQVWAGPSNLPEGYVVHACFGSTTMGQARAGVWWLSPYTKDAPRWAFVSPSFPACGFIPWLPILPQGGSLMFPP